MKSLNNALVITVLLIASTLAYAAVPQTINYQGYLKDTVTGVPANGPVAMTFSLYSSNPTRNNPVWNETQPAVAVSNGIYSTRLGSVIPISAPFDVPYWLGVNVNSAGELPLQPLTSTGYAFKAADADTVGGEAASAFATVSHSHTGTFVQKTGDTMSGALTLPSDGLSVGGTQLVLSGGKVGIGTLTPTEKLEVLGTVKAQGVQVTSGAAVGRVLTSDATGLAAWQVLPANNDNDPGNEYNTTVNMDGTLLQVTDGGGTKSVDLAEKLSLANLSDGGGDAYSLFLGSGTGAHDDGDNYNLAVGTSALNSNTSGFNNTALGLSAMRFNTTGSQNTVIGSSALASNIGGAGNTVTGYAALSASTSGNYNTANGYGALLNNIAGGNNVAVGFYALQGNTGGSGNVGIGNSANYYNQAGSNNTIIGYYAGRGPAAHDKSGNVFLGAYAGYDETGSNKLYIDNSSTTAPLIYGDFATNALTVNGTLTATGNLATNGTLTTVGNLGVAGNAAVGAGASISGTTTLNVRGSTADTKSGYFFNSTTNTIGYAVYGDASGTGGEQHFGVYGTATGGSIYNVGVFGSASGTGAYAGYFSGNLHATGNITYIGTLNDVSDKRLKENIRPVENGLAKVAALRGVYFNMKDNPSQTEVGVLAQDVQKVLPEAVSIVDQEYGYLGVSYSSLIPVLIEAVKELKTKNEALQADNAAFKAILCQDHPVAAVCQ